MLSEAKGQLKDASPSTDIPADCLKAANAFRDAIKGGDRLQDAAQELLKTTQPLTKAAGDLKDKFDAMTLKRTAMDVESATVKMKQAVDSIYGPYAEGRKAFYAVALAYEMYNPPASTSSKKPKDIKELSANELAGEISFAAGNLTTNVRDFLEKASRASKLYREAAKKLGVGGGEMSDSDKKALIDAGFDVRAAADPLFGRSQGIARRAVVLLDRLREAEKYEAKGKAMNIELAVADDAELGGLEIL
jgi:hypothetical protein